MSFKKVVLYIILCFLPLVAVSSELDPYSGIYKIDSDYLTYIYVKQVDGRYFLRTSYGFSEIIIANDGKFKPKDETIDAMGVFEDKDNNEFQKQTITYFGVSADYYRVDIPKDQYIATLYDSEMRMSNFSSPQGDLCDDSIESIPLSSVTDKSKHIDALISEIEIGRNNYNDTDSLLILKEGKLVVEQYFNGWSADEPHTIQSVSKSLTSLLVGSAITEDKLGDVNKTLPELLPGYKNYLNGGKENITLKHLLTMSAGIDWNEWETPYTNPENIRNKEMFSSDSVAFTLKRPIVNELGSTFTYSGGFVSVVGEVVRTATHQPSVSDYAKTGPLSALCFNNAYWFKQKDNRTDVAGGAFLRPRDMAKLGQLVLNDGNWNGLQIVDKSWMSESIEPLIDMPAKYAALQAKYGYYWWVKEFIINGQPSSVIFAHGYGGQEIVIVKDLDLVVVKTASNFEKPSPIDTMLIMYIIPAFNNAETL